MGVGVAYACVESVDVVFVLHQIEIDSDASVRCTCLVGGAGGLVFVVGFSYAQLNDGKVSVLQVESQGPFIGAVVAKYDHSNTEKISGYRESVEECGRIRQQFLYLFLMRLCCCAKWH